MPTTGRSRCRSIPHWDKVDRRLTWRGQVVFHFKGRLAPVVQRILDAFQEQGWTRCIDDPLPGVHGKDPKQRLRAAIENMNRRQINHLLRFRTNGTADGISWEPLENA